MHGHDRLELDAGRRQATQHRAHVGADAARYVLQELFGDERDAERIAFVHDFTSAIASLKTLERRLPPMHAHEKSTDHERAASIAARIRIAVEVIGYRSSDPIDVVGIYPSRVVAERFGQRCVFAATTGVPAAIASSGGMPNPS